MNLRLLFLALFIVVGCNDNTEEIVVCGDDQVLIIDKTKSDSTDVKVTWRWNVNDATDLPEAYRKYMVPTDECKPVDNNSKILITSSGGGVVLADRATNKSLFYAHVPMAHSAELLPGNRIVVALSTAEGGNCIELFDISVPELAIFKDSLYSGHGVVWMDKLNRLFALGFDELRSYSLLGWDSEEPVLELNKTWKLPDAGGHDLSGINENSLLLSTHHGVWIFDADKEDFAPFRMLEGVGNIKSANYDHESGQLVFTKGEISWWTHNIYIRNPDKTITIPDINIYKARVIRNLSN